MKTLFVLVILLSVASVNAASLLHYKFPFHYFMVGNELLACKSIRQGVSCYATDIKTYIKVIYKCKRVSKDKGYIKDCQTEPTI
jgi:hypothetical protein